MVLVIVIPGNFRSKNIFFWKKRLWSLGTLNVEICFRIWCVAYKFVLVG